jgi:metallo-beta-lactamase family protein
MFVQFHGAVQTVTGSQHLITVNKRQILLDCGFFQGKRVDTYARNLNFGYDPRKVDVLVLSHVHIDHSGNIPNLVKQGFRGDIVCTAVTRDLANIMLRDSAKIQESDVLFVNKKRQKQHLPPVDPIYTDEDVVACLDQFVGINYNRAYQLFPGATLTFFDAGHILGSAIVQLDLEDPQEKRHWRVVFSGDLGRKNRPILRDPTTMTEADILIMESTYGNREHDPEYPDRGLLAEVVNRTVARRGKIIIPAFAVGRTQELVYFLHEMFRKGEIPRIPIYVDSPLAIDATSIFRLHPQAYDQEMAALILAGQDPLSLGQAHYTRSVEESKKLNELTEPAIIISASGMAEAGRILHHLRNNIEDPRNTILIVGWQAPHTLGRLLVEKRPEVRIFGEPFKLRAEVVTMDGFSGHADRSELLDWAGAFKTHPKHTFLVHGEPEAAENLAQGLRTELGFKSVHVPELRQKYELRRVVK